MGRRPCGCKPTTRGGHEVIDAAGLLQLLRAMQITIDVPKPLSSQSVEDLARRARLLLVVDEVRSGHLTRAAGARALDMALDDFLIESGRHGLYAIDHDLADFRRELDSFPLATG